MVSYENFLLFSICVLGLLTVILCNVGLYKVNYGRKHDTVVGFWMINVSFVMAVVILLIVVGNYDVISDGG